MNTPIESRIGALSEKASWDPWYVVDSFDHDDGRVRVESAKTVGRIAVFGEMNTDGRDDAALCILLRGIAPELAPVVACARGFVEARNDADKAEREAEAVTSLHVAGRDVDMSRAWSEVNVADDYRDAMYRNLVSALAALDKKAGG